MSIFFLVPALTASQALAADEVKIGVIYSLTGPVAGIAKLQKQGTELAIREINDAGGVDVGGKKMKIEAVFCDDNTVPATATKCFEEVVKKGATTVIGGTLAHTPLAFNMAAKEHKAFFMASCAVPDDFFKKDVKAPTSLCILGGASDIGRAGASYLSEKMKVKKVAAFIPAYAYGNALVAGFEAVMKKYPDVTYKVFWHPLNTSDMKRDLTAVRDYKPDVIVIGSWGKDAVNALTEAHAMGLAKDAKLFDLWIVTAMAADVPPDAMKGVWAQMFWYHDMAGFKDEAVVKASNDFTAAYMKAYKDPPDAYAMAAYCAVKEIARAMEAAKSTDPTKMYQALMANPAWTSPKGDAKWREDGRVIYKHFDWIVEGKGADERKSTAFDAKYDYGKIVDSYPGEAFVPSLKDLGY